MSVFVYTGPGTSQFCVTEIKNSLKTLVPELKIISIENAKILVDVLQEVCKGVLVMPGGRDKPYQENLSGKGIEIIKNFVKRGGSYLGICAGAYFASDRVEFEIGSDIEVNEERDLKFFPLCCLRNTF